MIAVDTNILVPIVRTEYPHHTAAYDCIRSLAEGAAPWAIPWPCFHEFLAVVTNPRIFQQPLPPLGCDHCHQCFARKPLSAIAV